MYQVRGKPSFLYPQISHTVLIRKYNRFCGERWEERAFQMSRCVIRTGRKQFPELLRDGLTPPRSLHVLAYVKLTHAQVLANETSLIIHTFL